ncbi:MAG: Rrf2 family transcriptional regulator, partial [Angelakisella sp.]
ADYAVRIVQCLAQNGTRLDAKKISDDTGVTLRFSLKILRKLVSGGVIKSYKGTKGGYELAKEPGQITLADVIETVEGKYALARCVSEHDYQCNRNTDSCGICRFHKIYADISQLVQDKLNAVNFEELIK